MTKFQKIIVAIDVAIFIGSFFVTIPMLSLIMNTVGVILLIFAFARPKKEIT